MEPKENIYLIPSISDFEVVYEACTFPFKDTPQFDWRLCHCAAHTSFKKVFEYYFEDKGGVEMPEEIEAGMALSLASANAPSFDFFENPSSVDSIPQASYSQLGEAEHNIWTPSKPSGTVPSASNAKLLMQLIQLQSSFDLFKAETMSKLEKCNEDIVNLQAIFLPMQKRKLVYLARVLVSDKLFLLEEEQIQTLFSDEMIDEDNNKTELSFANMTELQTTINCLQNHALPKDDNHEFYLMLAKLLESHHYLK